MSKNEFQISLGLIFGINFLIIFGGITAHILPYWAASVVSNVFGLFCGFVLGGASASYLDRNKSPKK